MTHHAPTELALGSMIEIVHGDMFEADVDALVCPVNTVGVMGAGLALEFKRRHPSVFSMYAARCKAGRFGIGMTLWVPISGHRYDRVICVATKQHWNAASRLSYVHSAVTALSWSIDHTSGVRSVAIPALGCGLGGLDWAEVEPVIRRGFARNHGLRILLYAPT